MPENARGQVIQSDGRTVLRFVRSYPVSRDEVWSAITEADRTARWSFRAEMEPRTGGALTFDLGQHGTGSGTILEWSEPSVLEYQWGEPDAEWRIRFDLADDGEGGTVLTFDHYLPDPTDPSFAAGWHWHLDRLGVHLAGGVPAEAVSDAHFDGLMADYQSSPA